MSKEMPGWLVRLKNIHRKIYSSSEPYSMYDYKNGYTRGFKKCYELMSECMKLKPIEDAPEEKLVLCYGYIWMHFEGELRNKDWYVASKDSNGKWHLFYAKFQHGFHVEPTHWTELPDTEGL